MAERIVIEGNVVTRLREEVISSYSLDQLIQQTQRVLVTPILPNNCVQLRKRGSRFTVVIQHAPQKRSITIKQPNPAWDGAGSSVPRHVHKTHEIELPWMVNIHYINEDGMANGSPQFSHGGLKTAFRARPIMQSDLALKMSTLPNVWADTGAVCLGEQLSGVKMQSLQEMVSMAEGCLFNTDFNQEIYPDPIAFELVGGSFEAWEQLSAQQIIAAVNNPRWGLISSDW